MNTYVLNVTDGREEYSANLLRSLDPIQPYYSRIWIPQKPVYFRKDGVTELIHTVLYPSYIFIDSSDYYSLLVALRDHHLVLTIYHLRLKDSILLCYLWRGIHTGKVRKYEQGKEIHQWQRKMKLLK